MKLQRIKAAVETALLIIGASTALQAGSFSANFNDNAVPPGSAIYGNTVVADGVLKLTIAANSQNGGFVVDNLDPGASEGLNSVNAVFKLRLGGGTSTPADGFSFCVANDLPDGTWSEEGTGSGLIVAFDIYDNGGGEAPSVDLKWNGEIIATHPVPISALRTGADYVDVQIKLDSDGTLDVVYNGQVFYSNFPVTNFTPISEARTGFGGRTGGANENQWIDDLVITTTTGLLNIGFAQEPTSLTGLEGRSVTFRSQVNDPSLVTSYQWASKAAGGASFVDIPGANQPDYTTPPLTTADNGAQYQLTVVSAANTLVSDPATLTTVSMALPTPTVSYDFNDGLLPAGTALFGTATVTTDGGVGNSGTLRLTEAVNDETGAFVIPDGDSGKAVGTLTVVFDMQLGPGSTLPADGLSFNWANDFPTDELPAAEEGAGTGLTVSFDTYDNGGGEAPAVDLKWGGQVIASKKVPLAQLSTGTYVEVIIRVKADGTVDVVHGGEVLLSNVALPNFSGLANASFGFAAHTGGENQAQYVDNIDITTLLYVGPITITQQPVDAAVLPGQVATFTVTVNDPSTTTFQWQSKTLGAANFTDILGATSTSYVTPPTELAANGTQFQVRATGPANSVLSDSVVLSVVDLQRPTSANIGFDFSTTDTPAGTALYGTAYLPGDGSLHLTDAVNDQSGSFVINDVDGGNAVESWSAAFHILIGGGTTPPADGAAFVWGPDLPNGSFGGAEDGVGNGLSVTFDIYDNAGGEAPAIGVKWKGAFLTDVKVPASLMNTDDQFVDVLVKVTSDGKVSVAFRGTVIAHDLLLPGYTPVGGWRFGFGARTGGLNANQWLDDVAIKTTVASVVVPVFLEQPASQTVLAGHPATLTVQVNDPARISLKWQRKAPGDVDFADVVPAATGPSYTTPVLTTADTGVQYRAFATSITSNTATSDAATLTVVEIVLPTPQIIFDFNDGLLPAGTSAFGTAIVDSFGGVGDSGKLSLTVAENSQGGTFIVDNISGTDAVTGMVTTFKMLLGGGTTPPADGVGFVWAADLSDGVFGEDGSGSGLVVSFDVYDNGQGEAPAIDVRYNGNDVASTKVPASLLDTDGAYVEVIARVEADGTFDLVFDNQVIYYSVPLPGFTSVTGGRFGWGGRTGGLNENQFVDDITISTSTGTVPVTPVLSLGGTADNPIITFTGVLQSADSLSGTYQDVPGAVSPYAVPVAASPAEFYRSRSAP